MRNAWVFRPLSGMRTMSLVAALTPLVHAQFVPAANSPVAAGGGPSAVVAADFDNNGIQDLAVANYATGKVTVLLANAMGEFTLAQRSPITVGLHPVSLAVFNFNGNASLAVANEGSNTVSILLGNGDGTFTVGTPIQPPTGSIPISIAAGNFNGSPGLAIAYFATGHVGLWTANSTGVFSEANGSPFQTGKNPSSVVLADFNGDGMPDIAVTNKFDATVTVWLSNGAGGYIQATGSPFQIVVQDFFVPPSVPPTMPPPVVYPASMVTADFNMDGILDLAIANEGTNNVSVLLGNGNGGFAPTLYNGPLPPVAVGSEPFSLAVGYFNADIYPDLAVVNLGDNTVTILYGSATGAFAAASTGSTYSVGIQPESVAVGYFSTVGKLGLAEANRGSNTVTVLTDSVAGPVAVSAASLLPPVAPGSAITIFSSLATAATATSSSTFAIGGVSVTITDFTGVQTFLPLTSTAPSLINAVIPPTVVAAPETGPVPQPPAILTVYSASTSQTNILPLVPFAPGLYSANGTGKGVAQATFDGGQGSSSVFQCPAGLASCVPVPIDLSGGGSLTLSATGIRNPPSAITVKFGSQSLTPTYAGAAAGAAGAAGMDQVTVPLPQSTPSGLVPVSITAGGITSNIVIIAVQ